jgi:excinuclease UvrABC nuclease subunit
MLSAPSAPMERMSTWNPLTRLNVTLLAPPKAGVYALANDGVVIYVGQSLNLRERLTDHLSERETVLASLVGSGGAAFVHTEVHPALLDLAERNWVNQLRPTWNQRAA